MSFAGERPRSAQFPNRGGAAALVLWQPVLRGDAQVMMGVLVFLISRNFGV